MTSSGRGGSGSEAFEEGDKVKYHPTGAANVSEGEIKRIITEPEAVGGRQTVRASEEEPRYVIENVKTGKETGYKQENIIEKTDDQKLKGQRARTFVLRKPKPLSVYAMVGDAKVGARVVYHPVIHSRRTSVGFITKILTSPEEVGSRHAKVSASEDSPRYVIENVNTHKESAYKADNIKEVLL